MLVPCRFSKAGPREFESQILPFEIQGHKAILLPSAGVGFNVILPYPELIGGRCYQKKVQYMGRVSVSVSRQILLGTYDLTAIALVPSVSVLHPNMHASTKEIKP